MLKPDFEKNPLIPTIVQDLDTGRVLMLAYMNEESFKLTKDTGYSHFWSRSRQELWKKGATSGNTQRVSSIEIDCDSDTLLLHVRTDGPSCHTGSESCFDTAEIQIGTEVSDD